MPRAWMMGLGVLALFFVGGCSAPPTVDSTQGELVREVKQYVKETKGWDADEVEFKYDEFNTAWNAYWDGGLTMLPEHEKWHAQRHRVWFYQVIPNDYANASTDVLWIVVERRTGKILTDLETR